MRWTAAAATVLVAIIGGGALALWVADTWAAEHTAQLSSTDPAAVSVRLDVIKTALTVAAAIGAAVTLLLALRRQAITERAQQQTERAQQHTREDATERRITELYIAAVDQLGSDKAAVRLGGLYALERLGNDTPKLRQTIIDVLCAYLRMPFTPPIDILRTNAGESPQSISKDTETSESEEQAYRRQELQVRLTAQRLLTTHLYAPEPDPMFASSSIFLFLLEPATYWRSPDKDRMNLDLTGATLVNFDLDYCQTHNAILTNSHHHGSTSLSGAQFHGNTFLRGAQFHGNTSLRGVQFRRSTYLSRVQFYGDADLREVHFHGDASLAGARFQAGADLGRAKFYRLANLKGAEFAYGVQMDDTRVKNLVGSIEGWKVSTKIDDQGLYSMIKNGQSGISHAQPSDGQSAPEPA